MKIAGRSVWKKAGLAGLAAACWFLTDSRAEARLLILAHYEDHQVGAPPFRVPILLGRRSLVMDISELAGEAAVLIYNHDQGKIWHVRHRDKVYSEYDEAGLAAVQNAVGAAAVFLEQQWSKLAGIEKTAPSDAPAPPLVRHTRAVRSVGDWTCRHVQVMQQGETIQNIWHVPWEEAGLRKSDLFALIKIAEFYARIWTTPGLSMLTAQLLYIPMDAILDLPGYPAVIETYKNGGPELTIRLDAPTPLDAAEDLFQVPAGYGRVFF